jgi:hypothetical protein
MNFKMKKVFILILLSFISTSYSQVVYEPLHRDVYQYLSRLAQKGVIEFNDQIKPLSRIYIAEKLDYLLGKMQFLSSLEKQELNFYLKDFNRELKFVRNEKISGEQISIVEKDSAGRIRLFSYSDNLFNLNVSPILGYKIGSRDASKLTHFWNGIYVYGYLTDNIGVSFDFRDNTESGATLDKTKRFSPVTGTNERSDRTVVNYSPNKLEYSEAKTVISANWDWGTVSLGKEFFEWGYGEGGKLVLSQKSPSFPFIRLDINPVDWFSFNYIHAWLSSDIKDSSDIYYSEFGQERFLFRNKYLASHTLTIKPVKGLSLSIGESVVYSDRLELLYMIPVMFFRLADHYLSRQLNAAGSNAQIFGSISSRNHVPNTHLYGTLFLDEITITNIFNSERQRNQFGFSFGGSVVDIPVENLTLSVEYTKIYPFVYNHYISTTTYQNASYVLGHWMGHNGDQFYLSIEYRFLRGLRAKLWGQYIRKGEENDITQMFTQPQPPFLFGLRKNYSYFGGSVQYEFYHELFARLEYQTTKSSTQQQDDGFVDKTLNEFYFSVYYGL